jgi:hypothetical protein
MIPPQTPPLKEPEMANPTNLIVWSLSHAMYEYRIMLINQYVVIGVGNIGNAGRYHVSPYKTPSHARRAAVRATSHHEDLGYSLHRNPRQKRVDSHVATNLGSVSPGENMWLDGLFHDTAIYGDPL